MLPKVGHYGQSLPIPRNGMIIRVIAARPNCTVRYLCSVIWSGVPWLPLTIGSDSIRLNPRKWRVKLSDGRRVWIATAAEWMYGRCEKLVTLGKLQHGPSLEQGIDVILTTTYRTLGQAGLVRINEQWPLGEAALAAAGPAFHTAHLG